MDEPTSSNTHEADVSLPKTAATSRRALIWVGIACGTLALVGIPSTLWLGLKASTIESELKAATSALPDLQSEVIRRDSAAAEKSVEELKSHTEVAYAAATDRLWVAAGGLPWIGENFRAVTETATSAKDVAQYGVDPLVGVAQSLDWSNLTPSEGNIDLKPLQAAKPKLVAAAQAVRESSARLDNIDAEALLPQVSGPLKSARDQLRSLRGGLDAAANAASLAPEMMGATAPRHYLLLIQNNAESRATGGIPGALAVLNMDNGKLTLGRQASASELGIMNPTIPLDLNQEVIFSKRIGKFMQDVNLTPDFPTSASTAQAMWEQKMGDRLDGVISIDPVALSYLLEATGPIKLSSPELQAAVIRPLPTELSGKNVVKTLLADVYAAIPSPPLQDLYFANVAQELFAKLSAGKGDSTKIIDGIILGVEEGRVMVWSADPEEQAVIAKYRVGGSISGANISPAQFAVYFNDGTGGKMDYYVKRTAQLVKECTTDGFAQVKVRVTSTNTAPTEAATTLPAYVTGGGVYGVPEGTVQTNIVAYGPVQSNVETALVAGQKTGFSSQRHSGRPVGAVAVRLAPGQSSTVEFTFGKIVQHTEPQLTVTPTVQALRDVVLDTISAKCLPTPWPTH